MRALPGVIDKGNAASYSQALNLALDMLEDSEAAVRESVVSCCGVIGVVK